MKTANYHRVALATLMVSLALWVGLSSCAREYRSEENPDVVISKQLGYVYQVGIWSKVTYDVMKSAKENFCKVQLLDDYECGIGDDILRKFNGTLTVYSKVSTEWYMLEIKPENAGRIVLSTEIAKDIIKAMIRNRQDLVGAFKNVVGDKLKIPELPELPKTILAFAEVDKEVLNGS